MPLRLRVGEDVTAAAVGLKEKLRIVPARARRERNLCLRVRGHGRHVRGDGIGLLALDEIPRHRLRRELDLVPDNLPDRALLEALHSRPRESSIEVRRADRVPGRTHGACLTQRVAGAAVLREEQLAVGDVGALARQPVGPAAGQR